MSNGSSACTRFAASTPPTDSIATVLPERSSNWGIRSANSWLVAIDEIPVIFVFMTPHLKSPIGTRCAARIVLVEQVWTLALVPSPIILLPLPHIQTNTMAFTQDGTLSFRTASPIPEAQFPHAHCGSRVRGLRPRQMNRPIASVRCSSKEPLPGELGQKFDHLPHERGNRPLR
jgi:hypothetical protein